jgi:hypothetical protein
MSSQTSTFTRVSRATRGQRVTAISRFARTISRVTSAVLPALLQRPALQGLAFAGPGYITLALDANGEPAACPVSVYDNRTGELLADGHTEPNVGLLTLTRLPYGTRMRVVAAHASGRYEALVWDGIEDPTSYPPLIPFPPPESRA